MIGDIRVAVGGNQRKIYAQYWRILFGITQGQKSSQKRKNIYIYAENLLKKMEIIQRL